MKEKEIDKEIKNHMENQSSLPLFLEGDLLCKN